jgi:hypothetical protein
MLLSNGQLSQSADNRINIWKEESAYKHLNFTKNTRLAPRSNTLHRGYKIQSVTAV